MGIGSDISAGHTLNMMDNMRAAMEMSKTDDRQIKKRFLAGKEIKKPVFA